MCHTWGRTCYPSEAPESTLVFSGIRVSRSFVFRVRYRSETWLVFYTDTGDSSTRLADAHLKLTSITMQNPVSSLTKYIFLSIDFAKIK
jgi:hypothetical protein